MDCSSVIEHRGCRLAYKIRGSGVPVLFIQGTGVHGDGWAPQVAALADLGQCLTFDNRGMGRSQPLGAPLTVAQMAEDALAVMDAAGWDSAHVVGHSLGGLVALQVALMARARVRSLALLCTFARGRDATKPSPWMLWVGLRTQLGPRRSRRHAFLQMVLPPAEHATVDRDALAERLAPLFGHDLADQPPVAMKQLRAMSACDLTPRLAELAGLPTLVVSAGHDRIAPPASGRAIAAGISGARFVELAGAAHGVPLTDACRINALLLEHLSGAEH
ncbi:MAG: alpha/beta hydrolase [Lacunisphaera sp.]|nr:alpha/beta hydrolase [Lacunisphaera sp.]